MRTDPEFLRVRIRLVIAVVTALSIAPLVAQAQDADGDLIPDVVDNCVNVQNGVAPYTADWCVSQSDQDADGIGDACDSDFDQDGFVGGNDMLDVLTDFYLDDPLSDLNCNGMVGLADIARVLRHMGHYVPYP